MDPLYLLNSFVSLEVSRFSGLARTPGVGEGGSSGVATATIRSQEGFAVTPGSRG